ncbi:uncharacterized protein LOC113284192 isoform X2 [Papaver somniferum]|uniref:uncharacterized protein LOC113284192 isoform X2 n=1 Tax=Papaver somniferum TaxID=3469 RepID=UPI000E702A57|nr:uncharacterized protein LOC113284192 isoform X2 [Papaver somniferum]
MEDLSSRCMSVLLDFSFILIFGSTYLDAKYPISRYFRPSIRVPIRWILLPTIFMESAFLHSENTQTCNTKILDFGLAKGVATAIFSTAGTGFDKKIEGRTENMTPERPSITPISYLIMQASHDIQVHKSPQTLACK